jgi:hypothetical protein
LGFGYRHFSKSGMGRRYCSILSNDNFDSFSFSAASVAILDSFTVPTDGWSTRSGLTLRETETAAWWIDLLYPAVFDVDDISSSWSIAFLRASSGDTLGMEAYYHQHICNRRHTSFSN